MAKAQGRVKELMGETKKTKLSKQNKLGEERGEGDKKGNMEN